MMTTSTTTKRTRKKKWWSTSKNTVTTIGTAKAIIRHSIQSWRYLLNPRKSAMDLINTIDDFTDRPTLFSSAFMAVPVSKRRQAYKSDFVPRKFGVIRAHPDFDDVFRRQQQPDISGLLLNWVALDGRCFLPIKLKGHLLTLLMQASFIKLEFHRTEFASVFWLP